LLAKFTRRLVVCPHQVQRPQAPQDAEELRGAALLLAQLACAGVRFFYLGGSVAFGRYEWPAQGNLQHEFLLEALGSLREGLEQLDPFGEVADRFSISTSLGGILPCLAQILHRPAVVPPLVKMHRQLCRNLSGSLSIG
jgi:hypothetical protein